MSKLYKYQGPMGGAVFGLALPKDAQILSVGIQPGGVVLWASVDPDQMEVEPRMFASVATGSDMPCAENLPELPEGGTYSPVFLGTAQAIVRRPGEHAARPLVEHLFELCPSVLPALPGPAATGSTLLN